MKKIGAITVFLVVLLFIVSAFAADDTASEYVGTSVSDSVYSGGPGQVIGTEIPSNVELEDPILNESQTSDEEESVAGEVYSTEPVDVDPSDIKGSENSATETMDSRIADSPETGTDSISEAVYENNEDPVLFTKNGRVFNWTDGSSIANVKIIFIHQETKEEYLTFTNSCGVYEVELPLGTYDVYLTRKGFDNEKTQLVVSNNDNIETDEVRPAR